MKPSKVFFWFFWGFLCLVAGITLIANVISGNFGNIAIIISITVLLTVLSLLLYKRLFLTIKKEQGIGTEKRWFIGFMAIVAVFVASFACKISYLTFEIPMPLVLCILFTVLFAASGLMLAYIAFASLMGILKKAPDWVTSNRLETLLMAFAMFILVRFIWI